MKVLVYSAILIMAFVRGNSQVYQPISFPEKVDKKYVIDPLAEQEKYAKRLKSGLPRKVMENFTVSNAFTKSELFSEGNIYLTWPEMEEYLNHILDSIMPANLISKKIRAYVGRSSSINAFCLYDGTMVVNVGLLAEVKNEAALAIIMGHELGHYIKNHMLNQLKKSLKAPKKNELKETLNAMGFSQTSELEADAQGFGLAKNANYDLEEGMSNFEIFIRENEYYSKRNKSSLASTDSVTVNTKAGKFKANTLEKLLSSHPDMKDRKEKLAAFIKANPQTKKVKFKGKEEKFIALQTRARLESIALVFNSNDYQECLERAFTYHLFHPTELTFDYYIAESVRRLCLMDYRLRKKGFLTERLTNDGFKEGEGILHDLKFLIPNEERFKEIKVEEHKSGKYAFETYKEAFYYFTGRMIAKKYSEAYLMQALFENNRDKINDNVSKYLAASDAKHKEFAKHYAAGTLTGKVSGNSKEIVMIPRVNFFRNQVFNTNYNYGTTEFYYKKSELLGKEMAYEFANDFNNNLTEVKAFSMPQAAIENFNTRYKYQTIINRTIYAKREENEGYEVVHYYKELEDEDYIGKIDLFRLDPETWEFFNSNEIKAITFARYSRHLNLGARKLRNLMLIMAIPTGGFTLLFVPGIATNYKMLTMYSYDANLGFLYYDFSVRPRRINSKKARSMYYQMKKEKEEYVKERNNRY